MERNVRVLIPRQWSPSLLVSFNGGKLRLRADTLATGGAVQTSETGESHAAGRPVTAHQERECQYIMSWKQQGGDGGNGQGPWGRGGGGGAQAPDFEEMLRKSQDRVKRFIPGGFGSGRGILFAVVGFFVLWLVFGGIFYRVQPDEQGVVLRFGKWVDTTPPGSSHRAPAP